MKVQFQTKVSKRLDDNDVNYYDRFGSDDKNDSEDIYNSETQECNC